MSDIPFLNPAVLKQLNLPVPKAGIQRHSYLRFLDLNQKYEPTVEIQAYRKLYGLHLLECLHRQGYVQMPLFKLHVQVFTPDFSQD